MSTDYETGKLRAIQAPLFLEGEPIDTTEQDGTRIEILQNEEWRWLRFAGKSMFPEAIQSLMHRQHRQALCLPYMQVLCIALSYCNKRRPRVLQLGLGGGCINRFLDACNLAETVTTLEANPAVESTCRQYFGVPGEDRVIGAPVERWLTEAGSKTGYPPAESFDLIIADLYAGADIPEVLLRPAFYQTVSRARGGNATLALNIPHPESPALPALFGALHQSFQMVRFFSVPDYRNLVMIATTGDRECNTDCLAQLDSLVSSNLQELFDKSILAN